jgi:glutathione S-transferase
MCGDRYSKGGEGGKGRYKGIYFWFFQAGLLGLTVYNGITMIIA